MTRRKKTTKKTKSKVEERWEDQIVIPAIPQEIIRFTIEGLSPLLSNRFHPSDLQALTASQTGKARAVSKTRDSQGEMDKSLWSLGTGYGFPAHNLLACFSQGPRWVEGLTMTGVKSAVYIKSTRIGDDGDELVPIICPEGPTLFGRAVGGSRGSARAVKFCGRFEQWSMDLTVKFDPDVLTKEKLLLSWMYAGDRVGIGGWRPACSGGFGRFTLKE